MSVRYKKHSIPMTFLALPPDTEILQDGPSGMFLVDVPGYMVVREGHWDMFVHRKVFLERLPGYETNKGRFVQCADDNWLVSEPTTGARLMYATYETRAQAIAAADEHVFRQGDERMARAVMQFKAQQADTICRVELDEVFEIPEGV